MKFNILLLLVVILAVLSNIGGINAQTLIGTQHNTDTDHYYQLYLSSGPVLFSDALQFCPTTSYAGVSGYLSTISTQQEQELLISMYMATNPTALMRVWISGSDHAVDGIWRYVSGPEQGQEIYDIFVDKCYTYCNFSSWQPNFLDFGDDYLNSYLYPLSSQPTNYHFWDSAPNYNAEVKAFLCEYGGLSDLTVSVAPPTGGEITISNLINGFFGENPPLPQIQLTKLYTATPEQITCSNVKWIEGITPPTVKCTLPPNSGQFQLTVSNGTNYVGSSLYQYELPFISYIYPSPLGNSITIVGDNFDANSINTMSIYYSFYRIPCINAVYLNATAYPNVIVCNITTPLVERTTTLFPIRLVIGKYVFSQSRKAPWYYQPDGKFYSMYSASTYYGNKASQYVSKSRMVGNIPFLSVVHDNNHLSAILKYMCIDTMNAGNPIFVPASPVTVNNWLWTLGPFVGQQAIILATGYLTPESGDFVNMATLNPSYTYLSVNKTVQPGATLVEYGGIPAHWQVDGYQIRGSTAGFHASLPIANEGHLFTQVVITTDPTISINYTRPPTMLPQLSIPSYYGGPFRIYATVDGVSVPGTQLINYNDPTISDITAAYLEGGKITINGDSFFSDLSLLSVVINGTIPCTNLQFVKLHTSVSCMVPPITTSVNLPLVLKLDNRTATSTLVYSNPVITSVVQSTSVVTVYGMYFSVNPLNTLRIYFNDNQVYCTPTSMTNNRLICTLPTMIKNGGSGVYVSINGRVYSQAFPFTFIPFVKEITPFPSVDGQQVIFNGQFLFDKYQNGTVVPFNVSLTSPGPITTQLPCMTSSDGLTIKCNIGAGTGFFNLQLNYSSGLYVYLTPFRYHEPDIESTVPILRESTDFVTIKGSNFATVGLTVSIENRPCTNPVVLNSQSLYCTFNSSGLLPPQNDTSYGMMVNVTVDGQMSSKGAFFYSLNKTCTPECSSNGRCNLETGLCVCNSGWIGGTCSQEDKQSTVDGPPPSTDGNGGAYIPGEGLNFSVELFYLRELSLSGNTIKLLPMSNITWTNKTIASTHKNTIQSKETYIGGFKNETVKVELELTIYRDSDTLVFAGQQLSMLANSIKYQISLTGWTFQSPLSTLEVIYKTKTSKQTVSGCDGENSVETSSSNDEGSTMQWLEIDSASSVLRAQFAEKYIIDNRYVISNVRPLNPSTDTLYQQLDNSTFNLLVSIQLPTFKNAIIDPNFGLLLKSKSDCTKENKWRIPVIVVCSVVGASLLVLAVFIIRRKRLVSLMIKGGLSIKLGRFGKKSRVVDE